MPRKGENIYKRKDGRWEGRYVKSRTATGRAVYGYVYALNYRDVKKKLLDASVSCQAKSVVTSKEVQRFQNVANDWIAAIKPNVKESTYNKYCNLLDSYILPLIGAKKLDILTQDLLEAICSQLLQSGGRDNQGLSPKTVADILSVIRSVLRFAGKSSDTVVCDTKSIRIKQTSKEMRILSRSEQERLCQYLYTDLNAYNVGVLVCLFTGLRIGELCALRWEDISLTERTIHVQQTLQRVQDRTDPKRKTKIVVTSPKSQSSVRTIPIPDHLARTLAAYQQHPSGYVFTNHRHMPIEPRTMENHFRRALERSNVPPAKFHALRHTFATRCVELGFDVKSLSEILGHSSVNITMNRYVHPSMELKRENMERLDALFTVR